MQIKILTLLFCLLTFSLHGEMPDQLLPEWQKTFSGTSKVRLPHWRFSDWGKKPPRGQHSGRRYSVTAVNGKVQVTLENPSDPTAVNMLFRTLSLKETASRLYRLKVTMSSTSPQKVPVKLRMVSSGVKTVVQQSYHTISGTPSEKELLLAPPAGNRNLQISISLLGPGKVTVSHVQLTAEPPPTDAPLTPQLPAVFTLPEKAPVELAIRLPGSFKFKDNATVTVTLPWGVRLISHSYNAAIKDVSLKVREKSVITLKRGSYHTSASTILLLLGSDLPPSDKVLTGSVALAGNGIPGEPVYFRITTVKDIEAVPPRNIKIALPTYDRIVPHENIAASDSALLRSGANILLTPRTTLQHRQLRTARISQRCSLQLLPVRPQKHCYYEALRNETFWGQHFIPALKRQILRFGSRHIDAIVCDSFLGQKRGIFCCCTLCRTEFADFAPKLPQRDIMNLSQGILNARYAKELRRFRQSRLTALWAGARLHLPVDSRGFARRPALIPQYPLSQVLGGVYEVRSSEAVAELHPWLMLPDNEKYDPAVNFYMASAMYKKLHKVLSTRTALIARFTVPVQYISAEELKFELFNFLFSGFSGVWADLPAGSDYTYRTAIARCALTIRENEQFFRRRALSKHDWLLKSSAPSLELPPAFSAGGTLLDLPRSCAPLKLSVWKWGGTTLTAIGNFSAEALSATLLNPSASPKWQGVVNGQQLTGALLKNQGYQMTVPPRSWIFLKFKGL